MPGRLDLLECAAGGGRDVLALEYCQQKDADLDAELAKGERHNLAAALETDRARLSTGAALRRVCFPLLSAPSTRADRLLLLATFCWRAEALSRVHQQFSVVYFVPINSQYRNRRSILRSCFTRSFPETLVNGIARVAKLQESARHFLARSVLSRSLARSSLFFFCPTHPSKPDSAACQLSAVQAALSTPSPNPSTRLRA